MCVGVGWDGGEDTVCRVPAAAVYDSENYPSLCCGFHSTNPLSTNTASVAQEQLYSLPWPFCCWCCVVCVGGGRQGRGTEVSQLAATTWGEHICHPERAMILSSILLWCLKHPSHRRSEFYCLTILYAIFLDLLCASTFVFYYYFKFFWLTPLVFRTWVSLWPLAYATILIFEIGFLSRLC